MYSVQPVDIDMRHQSVVSTAHEYKTNIEIHIGDQFVSPLFHNVSIVNIYVEHDLIYANWLCIDWYVDMFTV